MANISPVSDLRNYNKVLDQVEAGSPVYLTVNVLLPPDTVKYNTSGTVDKTPSLCCIVIL